MYTYRSCRGSGRGARRGTLRIYCEAYLKFFDFGYTHFNGEVMWRSSYGLDNCTLRPVAFELLIVIQ